MTMGPQRRNISNLLFRTHIINNNENTHYVDINQTTRNSRSSQNIYNNIEIKKC